MSMRSATTTRARRAVPDRAAARDVPDRRACASTSRTSSPAPSSPSRPRERAREGEALPSRRATPSSTGRTTTRASTSRTGCTSSRASTGTRPSGSPTAASSTSAANARASTTRRRCPSMPRPAFPAHRTCRDRGVINTENLANLESVVGKRFLYIGLPLRLVGGTGCPIRAVADARDVIEPGSRAPGEYGPRPAHVPAHPQRLGARLRLQPRGARLSHHLHDQPYAQLRPGLGDDARRGHRPHPGRRLRLAARRSR